ncbi:MAG TPA: hypothetical protein VGO53_02855, partial [Steroidobacteraceae bacterium]|nr:hypothetical protein [Steroidobacteraceae bacterium]
MIQLLIEAALRSLALGVVVGVAMWALRPRNPHLQKTVWFTVLLACVAMPFVLQFRMAPSFHAPELLVTLTPGAAASPAQAANGSWRLSEFSTLALSLAYAGVSLVLLARFAFGLVGVWRLRRATVPLARTVAEGFDIRVGANVKSPATFASTILLPQSAL